MVEYYERHWAVKTLDALMSMLVLTPVVILYWYGTFELVDIYSKYIFPNPETTYSNITTYVNVTTYKNITMFNKVVNVTEVTTVENVALVEDPMTDFRPMYCRSAILFVFAFVVQLIFIYVQDPLGRYVLSRPSPIAEIMMKRTYCWVYGLAVVAHWRGLWDVMDAVFKVTIYTPQDELLIHGLITVVGFGVVCIIFRCTCNVVMGPVVAASDLQSDYFVVKNRFRVPQSKHVLFLLDTLFSVIVLGTATIGLNRAIWYICDGSIYMRSYGYVWQNQLLSFGVGMAACFMTFFLQRPCAAVSRKLDARGWWIPKILFEDCFMVFATFAGMNIWRGGWGLCYLYVFPSDPFLGAWVCHVLGIGGMWLIYHGNTALSKGYEVDGAQPNGQGCMLPCSSFTIFAAGGGQTHRRTILTPNNDVPGRIPDEKNEPLMAAYREDLNSNPIKRTIPA